MTRLTVESINKAIRAEVDEHITLTRDEGYHTLTYDTLDEGGQYDEYVVMAPRTNDLSLEVWIEEAKFLMLGIDGNSN